MDSFEINKVLGAVLGTCLALLALNIAANAVFAPHAPEKPGYEIAVQEAPAGGQKAPVQEADAPIATRLASADLARGETSEKKCQACHTLGKGEPNRVGPNLYGIVGRPKASHPGFNYSAAMKSQKGNWTFEDLDVYLKNPREVVPGTNMTFAGISRATERADLLTYLNSKSDSPQPLPKAAEAPAPAKQAEAPAAGEPAKAPAETEKAPGGPTANPPAPPQDGAQSPNVPSTAAPGEPKPQ